MPFRMEIEAFDDNSWIYARSGETILEKARRGLKQLQGTKWAPWAQVAIAAIEEKDWQAAIIAAGKLYNSLQAGTIDCTDEQRLCKQQERYKLWIRVESNCERMQHEGKYEN